MEKELLEVTKKSGAVFIGGIVGACLGLLFNMVATRLMGAGVYGRYRLVIAAVGFFPVLVKLGMDQGLVYFIPRLTNEGKFAERRNLITWSLGCSIFLGLAVTAAVILQSDFITRTFMNKPNLAGLMRILAPSIVLLTIFQLGEGISRGMGRIGPFVKSQNIIIPLTRLATLILLALLGLRIMGLVLAMYAATAAGLVYLMVRLAKMHVFGRSFTMDRILARDLVVFSLPIFLNALVIFLGRQAGTLQTGYYLTEDKVGIFNIALRIGLMSSFLLNAFNVMFAPLISSLHHRGEMDKLAAIYKTITKWIVAANLIAFAVIALFSADIMRLFGPEFTAGAFALMLIAMGQVVSAGVGGAGIINVQTGHPEYSLYINFAALTVNFSLNILLIPLWGINGAAVGLLASTALANLLRLLLVWKEHRIHPYDSSYLKVVAACLLSAAVIFPLKKVFTFPWPFGLVVFSTALIALFLGFNVWFGLSLEDRLVLEKIRHRILPRRRDA